MKAMETKAGIPVPDDLAAALQGDPTVLMMWGKLRPSCQRRYVEHLLEAKKPETRQRRVGAVLRMTTEWYLRHYPNPNMQENL